MVASGVALGVVVGGVTLGAVFSFPFLTRFPFPLALGGITRFCHHVQWQCVPAFRGVRTCAPSVLMTTCELILCCA